MKTKLLAVIFASLALVGCGGNNDYPKLSNDSTSHTVWTEKTRGIINGRDTIILVDGDNHSITVDVETSIKSK